ncbi:MAG TPA: hypothetical protein PLE54_09390 [Burkholderiaceae bacterium]|nr:hypothetical protein [Burkholderiaceae bacterium]HQR70806.1 hypothetical protein [Burkholderiaceae bacterium]
MNRRQFAFSFLIAGAVATRAFAQADDRRRNDQGGGGGQPVGIYKVVSVDTYGRTVQLRSADGSTSTVKVPEGVYELSKLSVGDTIQVNFYTPDAMNPGLRAAAIWPVGR